MFSRLFGQGVHCFKFDGIIREKLRQRAFRNGQNGVAVYYVLERTGTDPDILNKGFLLELAFFKDNLYQGAPLAERGAGGD